MAIQGSPKKMAMEIAEGFQLLNEATLKKYNAADLKAILSNLQVVQRELRSEQTELNDSAAIKAKNMKMSRVNQAMVLIQAFAKRRNMHL